MRNSKPSVHSNVIPFRKKAINPPSATAISTSQTQDSTSRSRKRKAALRAQRPQDPAQIELEIQAMSCEPKPPSPELADEVALRTVRQILHRAGTGEAGKVRLPKLVQSNLDLMCRYKHPVGLILRDWLNGNRRFLPANFQTLVDYSTCVKAEETE